MNLKESSFIYSTVLGAVVGFFVMGGVLGVLVGALVALTLLSSLMFICFLVFGFSVHGIPRLPPCENECCRGRNGYSPVFTDEDNVSDWQCKCGIFYRKRGRHFIKISDKGETPYLRWNPFRLRWIPDDGQTND